MSDRLQAGGFTAEQAHTFASALAETAAGADLATRQDLLGTKEDLKRDLHELKDNLTRDLRELKDDLTRDLRELEQRLTIRLGGMLVVLAGVLSAVFHYLR
jgi:DNA repair exonuclease SbcCD ATPase subunit